MPPIRRIPVSPANSEALQGLSARLDSDTQKGLQFALTVGQRTLDGMVIGNAPQRLAEVLAVIQQKDEERIAAILRLGRAIERLEHAYQTKFLARLADQSERGK